MRRLFQLYICQGIVADKFSFQKNIYMFVKYTVIIICHFLLETLFSLLKTHFCYLKFAFSLETPLFYSTRFSHLKLALSTWNSFFPLYLLKISLLEFFLASVRAKFINLAHVNNFCWLQIWQFQSIEVKSCYHPKIRPVSLSVTWPFLSTPRAR